MSPHVIGIGNPDRGDDAVGLEALAALRTGPPLLAKLSTARGDMVEVMDRMTGADKVVLVDAMQSGARPGTIVRLDVSNGQLPEQLDRLTSTHAFQLAPAIELARSLGRMPQRLIVYGVEIAGCELGSSLSPMVAAALPELVARIREECTCTNPR